MKKRGIFSKARALEFRAGLLSWYDVHKRDLPWRRTTDPYAIWVSEIMLQQTRVAAVLEHYARWMHMFPTVRALAAAGEDEVLAAWSGLGYYRRARFLHRGAHVVAEQLGDIPRTTAELRKLPGVGAYTSAAIASIAFGEVAAVVDGNVERVILRQAGFSEAGAAGVVRDGGTLGAAEIQSIASDLIDVGRPGAFNQAMMELGATVCLPRKPLCLHCPVFRSCRTRGEHATRERKPGTVANISYVLAQRSGEEETAEILLQQRSSEASLMPGLWELPQIAEELVSDGAAMFLRHAILRTNYRVRVLPVLQRELSGSFAITSGAGWTRVDALPQLPLTGLARKILLRAGVLARPAMIMGRKESLREVGNQKRM